MPVRPPHAAGTPIWIDLMTSGVEPVRSFYTALFGWTFKGQGSEYGDYTVAFKDGQPVAAVVPPMSGPVAGQSAWCLYFATNDVYADAERLRELGGQVTLEPMPVGNQGHLLMATGAAFGLWQASQNGGMGLRGVPGSFTWAEVQTRDAPRARDFYTALLGNTSQPVPDRDDHTLYHGEALNAGVMQMDGVHWPPDLASHWMISFAVENADEAVNTAQANGGRLVSAPHASPYGRMAVLQDPAGASFSVIQPPQA